MLRWNILFFFFFLYGALTFHPSSLGISAVDPHCKVSSCQPKAIPSKLNGKLYDLFFKKCSKNGVSLGLYNHSSCSKNVATRQFERNSIWACSQVGTAGSDPMLNKISTFKDACWRFLRPHTIRGTALGSTALVARALIEHSNLIKWSLLLKAFSGLIALICGNGYIVGINQIYDIGIDKVNKPYLPIAAGDLSVQSAWFLVRGFLLNFGVYYATRAALGLPFQWSAPVAFITTFVTLFALVIAITKDLPDVEGDRKFQISTLATKLGVRNIAFLGSGLLLVNYVAAVLAAIYMPQAFKRSLMIPAHIFLALCLIFQVWMLEQANYTKEAISGLYRFIWNLFYTEYAIFPFI
ncbi:hypothetical protein CRYUN_Cryun08bG0111200 [Craigia yunnanensis]